MTIKRSDTCANKKEFCETYPDYGTIGATLKAIGILMANANANLGCAT